MLSRKIEVNKEGNLLFEDNLEVTDWFANRTENIDIWITDPPYPFDSQNGTNRYSGMYKRFTFAELQDVYDKMYKITNDGGRAFVFCNRDGIEKTKLALIKSGFEFLNLLIWDKKAFGGGYHFRNQAEYIIYVSKDRPKVFVQGISNVFSYSRPSKKDINLSIKYNPIKTSSKPYQIWSDILEHASLQDEVCADPFAGTNPMRAAVLLNTKLNFKFKNVYTNVYET